MVIDHHRSKERPVDGSILINPHVDADESNADAAWRHLCTVGLVFKLCHGLLKQLRTENHPVAFRIKLRDHLDDPVHPLPCYQIGGKILVRRSEYDAWVAQFRRQRQADVDRIVSDVLRDLCAPLDQRRAK